MDVVRRAASIRFNGPATQNMKITHSSWTLNHRVIQQVTGQKVLPIPPNCPEEIYQLMLSCWKNKPHERLSMKNIYMQLQLLTSTRDSEYLEVAD
ncbi:tyrosine-protein kinase receptor [Trichonephila clavipes]|nr:tyrosine-protein kinase receptor [Trichonephila clavipes]